MGGGITRWARDAKENSYQLIFILIPPKSNFDNTKYYSGLKGFLNENDIEYADLTNYFKQSEKPSNYYYWYYDGHFNNEGNEFVGELIARLFPSRRVLIHDK